MDIDDAKKRLRHLAARNYAADHRIPIGRLERYGRLENDVLKAGEEIKSLARFTSTQRTAFRKLLKKYKKWTGSIQLEDRFREQVLDDLKSFTKYDLGPLLDDYSDTLHKIRQLYEARLQQSVAQRQGKDATSSGTGSSAVSKLQSSINSGSRTDFDTAMAAIPLSGSGTFASYFVHPENLVELQVFMLQYMRYLHTRSRTNSIATPVSPSPRRESAGGTPTAQRDFYTLAADSSERFMKEQSAVTVDQREHHAGATPQCTRICAFWNNEDEATIAARFGASGTRISSLKRKHVDAFFDKSKPFLPRRGSAQSTGGDEDTLNTMRDELVKDEKLQPLYFMSSSRSRLVETNPRPDGTCMATLDTNISLEARSGAPDASAKYDFPFAVLQVREEGTSGSDFLKALDSSHLVERVRGFSMEYHAIWQLCKPSSVSAPFWIPTLSRDIRKLPPAQLRRSDNAVVGSASGNGSPSATLGSASNGSSVVGTTDATTAVETPRKTSLAFQDEELENPPLRSFRKKRRRAYARESEPQPQQKYWSEYDHPEDGSDAGDAYVIYIDPNERSVFEAFFDRIGAMFSRRKKQETDSLLPSPRTPSHDESSSDEEDGATTIRATSRTYGTLPRQHTATNFATYDLEPEPRPFLLPQFTVISLIASLAILVVAYVLAATGKKKLVKTVDAGVVFAVMSSVVFAMVGFAALMRERSVPWLSMTVAVAFLVVDAVGSAGLLFWMLAY